jgi:predicted ABC-type ATPase
MHDPNPKVIFITGPNGAGKSTIAREVVLGVFGISKYVNADTIARGLAEFDPWGMRFEAGRIMLEWVEKLVERREDFALETTLAGKKFARRIEEWRKPEQGGYKFHLIFLWLRSHEIPEWRVGVRVGAGGHDVPKEDIRRRYERGICNFKLYQVLAETWRVFDNSDEKPLLIAQGKGASSLDVFEQERWQQFCEAQNDC